MMNLDHQLCIGSASSFIEDQGLNERQSTKRKESNHFSFVILALVFVLWMKTLNKKVTYYCNLNSERCLLRFA